MISGTTITESEVLEKQRHLRAFLQGKLADSNLKEGSFFNDLLVKPASYLSLLLEKEADRVVNTLNSETASNVEDRTSSQVLDDLASNFFIYRRAGTNSQGVVRIEVSEQQGFVIQSNTIFTKSVGVEFFYAGAGGSDTDLVVQSSYLTESTAEDGSTVYYYDVPVEGTVAFIGSEMAPGDFLSMTPTVANLVRIYNTETFSVATGEETNEAFLQRIKSSLTTRGLYSRHGVEASILEAVDSAISVNTIGAASASMQRDKLSLNSTSVRVLGKANVYANTGFIPKTVTVDFIGSNTASLPSDIARAADVTAFFDYQYVSEISTTDGDIVVVNDTRDVGRAHGDPLGATEYRIQYTSPSNSSDLTNTEGSIYCRTSLENASVVSGVNNGAISLKALVSKGYSITSAVLASSSNTPLGVDMLLYAPTVKRVKLPLTIRLREDRPGDLPESFFKSDVARYINLIPATGEELNLSDIVHYIMEEYSSYIININLSQSKLSFSTLLPDGNKIYWDSETSTSYADSKPYYMSSGTKYNYELLPGYLDSLQVSDETSTVHCDVSDITFEEILS